MVVVSLQMQIYLVAGIAGIVCGALIVVVATLFIVLEHLRRRVKRLEEAAKENGQGGHQQHRMMLPIVSNGNENYAFTEPSIKPGEELSRRGYVMSADQIVPPRLHSTGNGMYSAAVTPHDNRRDGIDPLDGTRDASADFFVNQSQQLFRPQQRQSPLHIEPSNDLDTAASSSAANPPQRKRSQFNSNIMLARNQQFNNNQQHLQSRSGASTEFPSIDYDDVASSSTSNYYGDTVNNELVDDRRRQHY